MLAAAPTTLAAASKWLAAALWLEMPALSLSTLLAGLMVSSDMSILAEAGLLALALVAAALTVAAMLLGLLC